MSSAGQASGAADVRRCAAVGFLATLVLCGCAVRPHGPSAADGAALADAINVPGEWSGAASASEGTASPLAQWWLGFGDPLLAQLIAESLRANTSVVAAQAALRQARALSDVAAAALWPTLDASGTAQHATVGQRDGNSSFRVGLDASWELDIFGARRSALSVAEASAQASAATLGDVQVSLAAETAVNYLALRGAQARLLIAGDNLATQRETLQLTQWRLQAGLVTTIEADQARAAAEQTAAQIPALQTAIVQTRHALAVLGGRPPAALDTLLSEPKAPPTAPETLALRLPAETLRQRPDVRAAEWRVRAAVARVAQADAARLPNFRLDGSLGLSALTLGGLGSGSAIASTLLAGAAMPLFDGGARRAQVRAQQAALDQARQSYRATVLVALKDVEDALIALRGNRQRLLHLRNAADAAATAAQMARLRFDSGLIDFQTVLETQRTQLGTQDTLASAGTDVSTDYVRLYKALGGGWRAEGEDTPRTARP